MTTWQDVLDAVQDRLPDATMREVREMLLRVVVVNEIVECIHHARGTAFDESDRD